MLTNELSKTCLTTVKKWFGVVVFILSCLLLAGPAWAGTAWKQRQKLLASDGAFNDLFGCSVFISGDYAIVGAYYDNDRGSNFGSAYIFRRDGESWVQQAKLTTSDGAEYDYFGHYVYISADFAIVGAERDDDKGSDSGSAYIFIPCVDWPTADLNNDCFVDFTDFSIFADQWLKCGDPCDPNCQP